MLQVQNVHKSYGEKNVLSGASLSVQSGEIVSIFGKNASGKSTLIGIVSGLIQSDSGQVHFLGDDLAGSGKRRLYSQIQFVFQDPSLYLERTVTENYMFFGRLKNIPDPIIKKRMSEVFAKTGLSGEAHKKVKILSGGMKQKASLGLAFLTNPRLLVIDEVSTGLDIVSRAQIWSLIKEYREAGGSVLFISHDLQELVEQSDRIYLLQDGQLSQIAANSNEINAKCLEIIAASREEAERIEGLARERSLVFDTERSGHSGENSIRIIGDMNDLEGFLMDRGITESDKVLRVSLGASFAPGCESLGKYMSGDVE